MRILSPKSTRTKYGVTIKRHLKLQNGNVKETIELYLETLTDEERKPLADMFKGEAKKRMLKILKR